MLPAIGGGTTIQFVNSEEFLFYFFTFKIPDKRKSALSANMNSIVDSGCPCHTKMKSVVLFRTVKKVRIIFMYIELQITK